jgi:hypothetical protein
VNFKEKWQKKWNFEKKLNFVMGTAILILIVLAISLSATMFVYTLSKRNNEYAREHLDHRLIQLKSRNLMHQIIIPAGHLPVSYERPMIPEPTALARNPSFCIELLTDPVFLLC